MIYRSVTFDPNRAGSSSGGNNFLLVDNWVKNVVIKKMTQKFSLNQDEEEERQISKTEFNMDKKKVFIFYHYKNGRITNKSETYEQDELLDHNKSGDQNDGQETEDPKSQILKRIYDMQSDCHEQIK